VLPFVDIFGLRLHPYGILIVAGVILGLTWFAAQRGRSPALDFEDRWYWALIYAHILGGVLGGKIGFFIVEWRDFSAPPWDILLYDWNSGWVHWFEVIGAIACGWLCLRLYNRAHRPRRYAPYGDYGAAALALGLWIGRLACLCAGCCHGRPAGLPWAIRFTSPASSVAENMLGIPLHPTQLYEAGTVLVLCLFLMFYMLPRIERGRLARGSAFYGYLILYSAIRFGVEFFRGDDRGRLLWLPDFLSPAQWIALACGLTAGFLFWRQGIVGHPGQRRSIYV